MVDWPLAGGWTGDGSALRLVPGRKSQPTKNGRMDTAKTAKTSDVDPPKRITITYLIAAQESRPNPSKNIPIAAGIPARCRQLNRGCNGSRTVSFSPHAKQVRPWLIGAPHIGQLVVFALLMPGS